MAVQEEEILGKAYDARLMRRLIRYLKPYKWGVIGAIALAISAAALGPVRPWIIQNIIDNYIAAPTAPQHGFGMLIMFLAGSLVLQALSQYALTYVTQWIGQHTIYDIRVQLFRHLQTLALRFFDRNPVGRLVTRLTNDVEVLNDMFSSGVVMIFADVFVIVWIIVFMFSISWDLSLVTLSCLPLLVWATAVFRKKARAVYREVRRQIARLNAFMNEEITGMNTVQLFHQEDRLFGQFKEINRAYADANIKSIFYYALFYPGVELISAVASALVLWYGGSHVLGHTVSIGTMIAFFMYVEQFFRPIRDLSEKYDTMQQAMASSERIFKVLDDSMQLSTPAQPVPIGEVKGQIEFRNVWFAYNGEDYILKDISFTVQPGERVAFVGATGAGKTSITNLLCRFYEFQKGDILIDGKSIRDIDPHELRKAMAIVMQDAFLFSTDVLTNITLGDAAISFAQARNAAALTGADKFIVRLPEGYQEQVRERGVIFSSGEKQLLSFTRALAYDPKILILDEATANIDTASETIIQEATERLLQRRTSLVIAHRLSTIQHANQILVMHHGEIRERGTHQQLLVLNGIYARLYRLQYKDQIVSEAA